MVFLNRESLIKAMEELPLSEPLLIEPDDCGFLLEGSALNAILGEDNFVKTFFTANIVMSALREGGSVIYMDFDTIFTAFFDLMVHGSTNLDRLFILQPDRETIEKDMVYVCSISSPYVTLIVLDSITTLYHLLDSEAPSDINRKISVYLSLLQGLAKRSKIPIIITSMIRAKKIKKTELKSWFTYPTGGRALLKAKTILNLRRTSGHIEINVVKHDDRIFIDRLFDLLAKVEWGM
ncbi:MAG: hypothetical protein L6M37_06420 [Candidatus Methylarchaceae archaeon HK02M1]|nr:hypothetical protein [Candidatus Methylarchaceae archaeon HK01M]MCP8312566.1 hypothetical protein [Candidatus Methylarchaceae archaeon HK02M1]